MFTSLFLLEFAITCVLDYLLSPPLTYLSGPVELENVKEQYLKHHGHKRLGSTALTGLISQYNAQLIQGTFDSGPHAIQRDWLTLRIRWSQREWSDFWLQKHHLHWAKRSNWMMSCQLVPITVYSSRSWTIFRDHWMLKPIWPNPIYHQFLCHWILWISLLVGFFGFPLSWLHSEWLPLASRNRSRVVKIQVFDRALLSRGGRRSCCHPPEDGKSETSINFTKLRKGIWRHRHRQGHFW